MLRDIKLEDLPSYQIAMERGKEKWVSQGLSQGISQTIIENAIIMVEKFKISIEDVSRELNISVDELKRHLD